MEISTSFANSIVIISLAGRFDAQQTEAVRDQIGNALLKTSKLIVDLSGVSFMDSAALATLVQGMKHSRQAGGDLRVCSLQQPVRIIFELTRLDKAFVLYDSVKEAQSSF